MWHISIDYQNYYQQVQLALGQMHGVNDLVIVFFFLSDYLPLVMLKQFLSGRKLTFFLLFFFAHLTFWQCTCGYPGRWQLR